MKENLTLNLAFIQIVINQIKVFMEKGDLTPIEQRKRLIEKYLKLI